MMTQAEMIAMLKTGEFVVTFHKKDGERRVIRGSLPGFAGPKNETAVPIVESDTGLWKSFLVDGFVSMTRVGDAPEF